MDIKDRIIVAVDVGTVEEAQRIIEPIAESVGAFKFGLEFITGMLAQLLTTKDENAAMEKLAKLRNLFRTVSGSLFWDGKLMDIPNTVAGASLGITTMDVKMFNVHCLGGTEMMKATKKAADEEVGKNSLLRRPLILGVTLLTSLSYDDLVEMRLAERLNIFDPEELASIRKERIQTLVRNLAFLAQESGLDGVIASPQEIKAIRSYCQPGFLIVTPGVRPTWAATGDQKRVMTPGEAIAAGADALVIDRPITKPPAEIGSSVEAVKRITDEIASAL
ncbi:MAG: orotidine-5'-phosphate decarboxylase [bacterium]|nr:orotidine-5'-phosphate decarboxylase [bacterium]